MSKQGRKIIKRLALAVIIVIFILAGAGFIDYLRLAAFERPVFARPSVTADDGGSGIYQGIGYAFYLEGNFMPEDEYPGVTQYDYYLLGKMVGSGLRD